MDAVLNFLLFLPLGAGLSLFGVHRRRAFFRMSLLSASIEILQGLAIPGRDASLGDLLFNSLGGAAGFTLVTHAATLLRPSPSIATRLTIAWSAFWLGLQFIVAYALMPSLPLSRWYLQTGHHVESDERFPGSIIDVSLAERHLGDGPLLRSESARAELLANAPLRVAIRLAGGTRRTAPIVRLVDDHHRGIAFLAQRHTSLLLTMRTGADQLRLRPPMIELPDALALRAPPFTNDTVTVLARRDPGALVMTLVRARGAVEMRVPMSTSIGWTLVFPSQWRLVGGVMERAFSLMGILALLIPLGWWATRAVWPSQLIAITSICLGLVLLPRVFDLPSASPAEWGAAIAGVAIGAVATRMRAPRRHTAHSRRDCVEPQPQTEAIPRHGSATA